MLDRKLIGNRSAGRRASALAVPVAELGRPPEHGLVAALLGPEADLVAVRVVDERERRLGGEDQDPAGLSGAVDQLVGAVGSLRADRHVSGLELALAVWPAQAGPAGNGDD